MTDDLAELGVRTLEVQAAVAGGDDAAALGRVQAARLVKGVQGGGGAPGPRAHGDDSGG